MRMLTEMWRKTRRGDFVGENAPRARVTLQRPKMGLYSRADNLFASLLFGPAEEDPVELPNIKSVRWSRSIDSEVAECTVTIANLRHREPGETTAFERTEANMGRHRVLADLDFPGYYSPSRGRTGRSWQWGHRGNNEPWENVIVPDSMLRTYEGYGWDPERAPENDPNLAQTGVWLIDEAGLNHAGDLEIQCRDLGRLLLDQMVLPPVNPFKAGFVNKDLPEGAYSYPVGFQSENSEPTVRSQPLNPQQLGVSFRGSSNQPYYGTGPIYGHRPQDAFDGDNSSYWLSVGNQRRDAGYAFEWIEGSVGNQTVRRVKFRTRGTGYRVYLCIYSDPGDGEGARWRGSNVVPYNPNHPASAPNGSNTRYMVTQRVDSEGWQTITLPGNGISNVSRVRLTFGNLWHSPWGPYRHRAAVRQFEVYGGPSSKNVKETYEDKNYEDFTDIVKLLCAWAGFWWEDNAIERMSDGGIKSWGFDRGDDILPFQGAGRVFGDFELSGTAGPAPIPPSVFEKKPLMEGVNYVREILGFLLHIDELGGVVFRHPNIFQPGNRVRITPSQSPTRQGRLGARLTYSYTLDERLNLVSLNTTLASRNLRERIFISNTNGTAGAMARGWNPNPIGLRRMGGWTDQHFESNEECQIMADMISLRQYFTYRTSTVRTPGFPGIQIDDQVRIVERVTADGFIHYVKGITSTLDHETGEYWYDLDTHWLGEGNPEGGAWAVNTEFLAEETQQFLEQLFANEPQE